jgi:hypothetical protein
MKHGLLKLFALTTLALALTASTSLVQAEEMGWLVYAWPKPDGARDSRMIPGQARRVYRAWLRADNASVVDIVDEKGDNLPVHFFFESNALKFCNSLLEGESFDVSDCAHAGESYRAEFHCDLLDSVPQIKDESIAADRYLLNPDELSVVVQVKEQPTHIP